MTRALRLCLLVTLGVLISCGQSASTQGYADCADPATFGGHTYMARGAVVHPRPGAVVGRITLRGTMDCDAPLVERDVATLPGVDPSNAVVDRQEPETIYVRADLQAIPPEIGRYFVAPACRGRDAPIRMEGPWLAIPGTDANVEPDPVPPYSVEMLVTRTSAQRYADAELRILVPPSLGIPITHEDVAGSLWTGGTIQVIASCRGRRFVADSLATFPP